MAGEKTIASVDLCSSENPWVSEEKTRDKGGKLALKYL
jgi:hypothetical protein